MNTLARMAPTLTGDRLRAARQAAREALLAQASDWAFLITKGTATEFSRRQVATHIRDFLATETMARTGRIDEDQLSEIEDRDNVFPDIDPAWFLPAASGASSADAASASRAGD